jgi:hypothetical protein
MEKKDKHVILFRLKKDVYIISDNPETGHLPKDMVMDKEELDKHVCLIGNKGEQLDFNEENGMLYGGGGEFAVDSEFVEPYTFLT